MQRTRRGEPHVGNLDLNAWSGIPDVQEGIVVCKNGCGQWADDSTTGEIGLCMVLGEFEMGLFHSTRTSIAATRL